MKHYKKVKEEEPPHKKIPMRRSTPPLPQRYTLLNSRLSDILNYMKEEGYSIQTSPPIKAYPGIRKNKDMLCTVGIT